MTTNQSKDILDFLCKGSLIGPEGQELIKEELLKNQTIITGIKSILENSSINSEEKIKLVMDQLKNS